MFMVIIGGCNYSGPPHPYSVGTSRLGTLSDSDVDPLFVRIHLGTHISSSAQLKNLLIQVSTPDGVKMESSELRICKSDKSVSVLELKPDPTNTVMWRGEMHPKHSLYEKIIKKFDRDEVILNVRIKVPKADRYFKGKIRIHVSFDYYDDPTADPNQFRAYGSHDEIFEVSADDLTNDYHPKETVVYGKR